MHFGLALIAAASAQDATTRTLPAAMPALIIQGSRADLTLHHDPTAASSQVTVTPTTWWEGCEVAFTGNRREATVAILEEGEPASRSCAADIVVTLAGSTNVSVALQRGVVDVAGMPGALQVDMDAGRLVGTLSGEATVSLGRGRVTLWDLTAPVDAAVRLGSIDLTFSEAVIGTVAANTGVGPITTRFPYGTWLDASVLPGVGRTITTIPSRQTATTHLDAASRVGSIRVEAVVEVAEDVVVSAAE